MRERERKDRDTEPIVDFEPVPLDSVVEALWGFRHPAISPAHVEIARIGRAHLKEMTTELDAFASLSLSLSRICCWPRTEVARICLTDMGCPLKCKPLVPLPLTATSHFPPRVCSWENLNSFVSPLITKVRLSHRILQVRRVGSENLDLMCQQRFRGSASNHFNFSYVHENLRY